MSLPEPELGLVIRYAYLWKSDYDEGREEGVKDRPCAIVLNISAGDGGARVTVLPITHLQPQNSSLALEIPPTVKRRLGLDDERSWIILNEGNEFTWPGPDLRPQPEQDISGVAYGFLPPKLFAEIMKRFIAIAKSGLATKVKRTE